MVRKFKQEDLEPIMAIWLNTNIQAHGFISREYWFSNFDKVKDILPQSQVYVYENQNQVQGFIGVDEGYIAGIFVLADIQSKGVGKLLLDECKSVYSILTLNVYEKNNRAIDFYLREGFIIDKKQIDKNTGEIEFLMVWKK